VSKGRFNFTLLLVFFFIQEIHAQNTLNTLGLTSSTPTVGAYGLRRLSSSYTGDAILVRRSSDNTTQNIGFTASGLLNESALLSFVGSGSGFVQTWYDQSGNGYNATTSAGTPTYSSSTGITFPGTAHMASSVLSSVNTESGFIVLNNTVTGYQGVLGCSISGGREIRIQSAAEGNVISVLSRDLVGVLDSTIAFPKNTDTLLSYHCNSAFWFNGTARGTGQSNVNYAVNGAGTTIIGASGTSGGNRFTGTFKEIILYNFVLSAT
jgi:hypothetical protein